MLARGLLRGQAGAASTGPGSRLSPQPARLSHPTLRTPPRGRLEGRLPARGARERSPSGTRSLQCPSLQSRGPESGRFGAWAQARPGPARPGKPLPGCSKVAGGGAVRRGGSGSRPPGPRPSRPPRTAAPGAARTGPAHSHGLTWSRPGDPRSPDPETLFTLAPRRRRTARRARAPRVPPSGASHWAESPPVTTSPPITAARYSRAIGRSGCHSKYRPSSIGQEPGKGGARRGGAGPPITPRRQWRGGGCASSVWRAGSFPPRPAESCLDRRGIERFRKTVRIGHQNSWLEGTRRSEHLGASEGSRTPRVGELNGEGQRATEEPRRPSCRTRGRSAQDFLNGIANPRFLLKMGFGRLGDSLSLQATAAKG